MTRGTRPRSEVVAACQRVEALARDGDHAAARDLLDRLDADADPSTADRVEILRRRALLERRENSLGDARGLLQQAWELAAGDQRIDGSVRGGVALSRAFLEMESGTGQAESWARHALAQLSPADAGARAEATAILALAVGPDEGLPLLERSSSDTVLVAADDDQHLVQARALLLEQRGDHVQAHVQWRRVARDALGTAPRLHARWRAGSARLQAALAASADDADVRGRTIGSGPRVGLRRVLRRAESLGQWEVAVGAALDMARSMQSDDVRAEQWLDRAVRLLPRWRDVQDDEGWPISMDEVAGRISWAYRYCVDRGDGPRAASLVEALRGRTLEALLPGWGQQLDAASDAASLVRSLGTSHVLLLQVDGTDSHGSATVDPVVRAVWFDPAGRAHATREQLLDPDVLALLERLARGDEVASDGAWSRLSAVVLPEAMLSSLDSSGANDDVVVVPSGPLWAVPFPALPTPGGRVLAHMAAVSVVPSLRVAAAAAQRRAQRRPRGTTAELRVLAHFGTTSGMREEREYLATHARLRVEDSLPDALDALALDDYDLLTLSTHGLPAQTSGGYALVDERGHAVGTRELLACRMPPVVVLGACFSAPVDADDHVDPLALATAALLAGADHVLGSHRSVADAAASDVLLGFYERVRLGLAPAQALQSAQMEILAAYPSLAAQPHAWALTHFGLPSTAL